MTAVRIVLVSGAVIATAAGTVIGLGLDETLAAGPVWWAGGGLACLGGFWFAHFLGESWIEDLVKTVVTGLLLFGVWDYPRVAVLASGLFLGFLCATAGKLVRDEAPRRRSGGGGGKAGGDI